MRVAHRLSVSRTSLQPVLYLAFAVCFGLVALAVAQNPVAVALPIGGTVAAIAMVWSIDQLQSRLPSVPEP